MSVEHNRLSTWLAVQIAQQLDASAFDVRVNMGHVRRASESYYIPDVYVIPIDLVYQQLGTRALEVYRAPLPLVVEVWSPSTGEYDVDTKLTEYQHRGDIEIWRIHPYERTLTAWRRTEDGSYVMSVHSGGAVHPVALPSVAINLDVLFALIEPGTAR
jgi:Uma2 family endonuclease